MEAKIFVLKFAFKYRYKLSYRMANYRLDKNSLLINVTCTANGKTEKFYPGISITNRNWSESKQHIIVKKPADEQDNLTLSKYKSTIEVYVKARKAAGELFAKEDLEAHIKEIFNPTPKVKADNDFVAYVEEQIKESSLSTGTLKGYKVTLNNFLTYLKESNLPRPTFEQLNLKWINGYTNWLTKNYALSTKDKHIKDLKSFLNKSLEEELHNNTSFKKAKRVKRSDLLDDRQFVSLTEDELELLYNLPLEGRDRMAREYFCLGCYTAARWSDLSKLGKQGKLYFSQRKEGWVIDFRQTKTKGRIKGVPVIYKEAIEIMKRNNWNIGDIPEQEVNDRIKTILSENGIMQEQILVDTSAKSGVFYRGDLVSLHSGRRTFCTILFNKGVPKIPVHLIMIMSGHKDLDEFMKYVTTTTEEMAEQLFDYKNY